jgi:hypothetical protein
VADKETDDARKAFVLHDTIEVARKNLKTAIGVKPVDPPAKPDDKKPKPEPTATVTGKVSIDGKPVTEGEVALVATGDGGVTKAKIAADGTYSFAGKLVPGKYAVTVTGAGVPAKYKSAETSGLVLELTGGAQTHDIELK